MASRSLVMRAVRSAGLAVAVVAFSACNAILGNESDYRLVLPEEAGASSCESRSDCPGGNACLFGECHPTCLGDLDCQAGVRCLRSGDGDAACVSATAARCRSGECPEGLVCSRGACRNRCATSSECLSAQQCVASSTPSIGRVCVGTDPTRDPDASGETSDGGGSGGAPGSGGRPSTGGRSTTGGSGPEEDGGGDASSDAGPCVPTGPEACFNGLDDDCNGETDCEDDACGERATCVPGAAGATLGTYFVGPGPCPSGYSPVGLNRGLDAPYGCQGCSCVPNDSRCESGIYGLNTCPGFNFKPPLYNVFSHECWAMSPGTSIHYYNVRGFATCTPVGTGTPSPASWAEGATFCVADQVGAGCAGGGRCVPRAATPACAMTNGAGACAATYPNATGEVWYEGYDDARQCLECSCSFGSATCAGAYIAGYEGGNCSGAVVQIGNGAEGDNCALPFAPVSGQVIGSPTNPSCPPNTGMTGEATPTNPRTVCCL